MKALLYILFVLSFILYGKAQDYDSMPDTTMVDHARYGTYVYEKHRGVVYVHELQRPGIVEDYVLNKDAVREIVEKGMEFSLPTFYLQHSDKCSDAVVRNIKPYLSKEYLGKRKTFFVKMILDSTGKIKNIYFRYPRGIDIPATVLETLFLDLKENCYVTFRKTDLLEDANNVPFLLQIGLDEIYYDTLDRSKVYECRLN